jgi:methyltransferase (TIGR00027 family)
MRCAAVKSVLAWTMTCTDSDTWNAATNVGATATMVAAARWCGSRADNPLIRDPLAEKLVRAVGIEFFTRWGCGELEFADIDRDADEPSNTARMTEYVVARTGYFDDFFLDATAAGIRQAVILACGLDSRSYRLAWPAGMVVFEIDSPRSSLSKPPLWSRWECHPVASHGRFPST